MSELADDTAALRLTRRLPCEPARAWGAWTEPTELSAWFWPQRFATTRRLDPQVGGRYRIASASAEMAVSGEVIAVEPLRRLGLTWRWHGEADETLLTLELLQVPGGTDVGVVHERFAGPTERDEHVQGWDHCLDRLVDRLS